MLTMRSYQNYEEYGIQANNLKQDQDIEQLPLTTYSPLWITVVWLTRLHVPPLWLADNTTIYSNSEAKCRHWCPKYISSLDFAHYLAIFSILRARELKGDNPAFEKSSRIFTLSCISSVREKRERKSTAK